jgi:CRP-like cAMP-binding protein
MDALFRFLTQDDQRLLLEKARRLTFQPGEVVIAEGSTRQALFFVHSGHVRIERERLGVATEVTRLGPGEIFGEMAFVEDRGASASVVADGTVEVDVIEGGYVHALLMSVPGLAARFFQSLAVTLSNRLRDTSDKARS